jgi:hypothetical protein
MRMIKTFGLCLALATVGSVHAAPVVGSGGGYFGTAEYDNGAGSVVGPYATWIECSIALQNAINNAVNNFGYTLESVSPCSYTPPYSGVMNPGYELEVMADSPASSADVGTVLLDEARRIREAHRADDYDAAIGELVRIAGSGKGEAPKR